MKRILTGGLVALLLASMLPATALAAGPALTFGSEPPPSVASNANFSVTVHAVDASDVAVFGDVVTLGLKGGTGTGGASFACDSPTATTDAGGDATFTGCSIDLVGSNYQLTASDATPLSVDSTAVDVTPGTATKLVVTSQPSASATASVAFAAQPEITIEDAAGNVETGDSSTQVAIGLTSAGGATLAGTKTVTASAGVVSFSNLSINKVGTYTLTATSGGLASAVTGSIVVGPASADHLVVTATTPQTAGTSFSVTVTAKDPDGNTDTGYAGTVHFTTTDGGAGVIVPTDYVFQVGDHGVHTFSNGVKLVTAATQTVTATDTIASSVAGTSGGIVVKASSAVSLVVSGFPDPVTAGTASTVTVTAKDTYGNVATGYTGDVAITSSDPAAVLPGAHTFTVGDAGVHVFAVTLLTTGLQSISAGDGSLSGSQTAINVDPATATHLTVVATTPHVAGTAFSVTVTALDSTNNTDTNYTGTIHFTSTDAGAGVALPSDYTFVTGDHGVHTFSAAVTLATVGNQTVTATDTTTASIHGTTASIVVNPGVATHFVLTGVPSTVTAGAQQSLTVTAKDAEGNTATGYTGTVTITSTDGAATKDAPHVYVPGDAGVHLFHVTFKTSGTQSLTADDGPISSSQAGITVNPAAAVSLAVTAATSQVAGAPFTVTVTVHDTYGNTVTGYAGSIHFTSTDPGAATLPTDYTFVPASDHGVHAFTNGATLVTAGTRSITAGDGSLSASQTGITVVPATASVLVATATSPQIRTVAFNVAVTAYDPFGNVATGYRGTVGLSSTDPGATLPTAYTFTAGDSGSHALSVKLNTAGAQTVTATDQGNAAITGTTSTITVNATGNATQHLTFAIAGSVYGAANFTVAASSDAGLTVFTYVSKTTGVCTVSLATVHIAAAGLCTITANQAGDPTYAPASIDASFTVAKAVNKITFTTTPTPPINIGGSYTIGATAASGGAVTFSIKPVVPVVCSMTDATHVSFAARGTCLVDATSPATQNYLAGTGQQSIPVSDIAPTCSATAPVTVIMNVAVTGSVSCLDAEHDYPLTYSFTQPSHGTVSATLGQWTYTPNANAVVSAPVSDSFTFRAQDSLSAFSLPVTVSLTIVNRPVKAKTDAATVRSITPTSINVLANDLAGYLATAPTINQDPGQPLKITAVTQGSLGTVTTDGHTVTYDPNGCAYGSDLFSYTATDGVTTSTAYVAVTVARPGQSGLSKAPVTNTPTVTFAAGSKMGSTVPVKVGWCGLTATSTRIYRVIQSSNGGSTYPTTVYASTKVTSAVRSLTVGAAYAWRVRTLDGAGHVSAYATSPKSTVTRFQNTSPQIVYAGAWSLLKLSAVSGGSEAYATSTSATATLTLPAGTRSFAIVSAKASNRGSLQVWVDGVLASVVSEKASSGLYQILVSVRNVSSTASHTIVIRPVGNGRIDLDAILTLQ